MKIRLTEEEAIQIKTACKKAREKGPCQQGSQPGLLARWQQPYQLSFNLIVVWSAPTPEEPNTAEVPVIWGISEVEQGSPPTVRSVGNQEEVGEWEKCDDSGTKFDYGDGYFNDETGGSLQRHTNQRPVVSDGVHEPYQLPGSYVYSEVICQGQQGYSCDLYLTMDSRTAAFYVNCMERTYSFVMSRLATQLWHWCQERNIVVDYWHLRKTTWLYVRQVCTRLVEVV